jgi:hypothetical protein
MKSKLSAVLVAAGCVLAVSPANALSFTTDIGATTSSIPGAILFDDFDTVQNPAVGTITGGLYSWSRAKRPRITTCDRKFHLCRRSSRRGAQCHGDVYKPCQLRWLCLGTTNSMDSMVLLFSVHLPSLGKTCPHPISTSLLVQGKPSLSL